MSVNPTDASMTATSSLALFGSMVILALIPGPAILAVVARTLAAGLRQGVSTVAGLVAGDFVFITLALLGLSALSEMMGALFLIVKYLGAGYLVWLGISLIISKGPDLQTSPISTSTHLASFTAGLLTTLSNPKAIIFYLSFFPAFLDLAQVTALDAAILYVIATIAVGGVMFGYAYGAYRAKRSFRLAQGWRLIRIGSGILLLGSGVFMAARR